MPSANDAARVNHQKCPSVPTCAISPQSSSALANAPSVRGAPGSAAHGPAHAQHRQQPLRTSRWSGLKSSVRMSCAEMYHDGSFGPSGAMSLTVDCWSASATASPMRLDASPGAHPKVTGASTASAT